jgi:serine phosphatase RsbU (regulator of sigma subunit)
MHKALLIVVIFLQCYGLFGQVVSTDSLLKLSETSTDSAKIEIYLDVAIAFRLIESDLALEYGNKALQIAKKEENIFKEAQANNVVGSIYTVLGEYQKAILFLQESIKLFELLGNVSGIANASNSLGILYFEQGEYSNALSSYQRALNLADPSGNPGKIATYKLNIGEIYQVLGRDSLASALEKEALQIFTQINDKDGMAYAYGVLAKIQFANGEFENALNLCNDALKLFIEAQDHLGAVEYLNLLMKIRFESEQYAQAIENGFAALKFAKQINSLKWKINTYNLLAHAYKESKNYLNAYTYQDSSNIYQDSLMDADKQRQITNLRIINESNRKERENEILKVERELQNKKIAEQQIINISISSGIILITIFAFVTYRSKQQKQKANKLLQLQNDEISLQREEIEAQSEGLKFINREVINKNKIIEEKNKDITDSINYAKRIQNALLPFSERIAKVLPEHFIFYKPKDIVSGDFYWFKEVGDKVVIAVADCTGHGIPGAFMSFIGHDMLNHVVNVQKITKADQILNELRINIVHLLQQEEIDNRDGMDISISIWDRVNKTIEFAGANHRVLCFQNKQLQEFKGDRSTVGFEDNKTFQDFSSRTIPITSDTEFYLFTDGYIDQFGGKRDRKFMMKKFRDLLLRIHHKKMDTQGIIIRETMEEWMEDTEQVDDILVMGFRLYD